MKQICDTCKYCKVRIVERIVCDKWKKVAVHKKTDTCKRWEGNNGTYNGVYK